jgi:hypothetical protein
MMQVDGVTEVVAKITADLAKTPCAEIPGAATIRYRLATSGSLMRISLLSTGVMMGVAFGFLGVYAIYN